jgi:hypothetical protein
MVLPFSQHKHSPFYLVQWAEHVFLESKDERVFLLDESLHFRSTFVGGSVILAWRDLSGDPGDVYKFICDSNTQPSVSHTFELVGKISIFVGLLSDANSIVSTAYQCMWERKYHKSHEQATEADLEQFNFAYRPSTPEFNAYYSNSPIPSASPTTSVPASPVEQLNMKALAISQTKPPPPMNLPVRSEPATLVRVSAQLHLFDAVEGVFMLQDENVVASVIETGPWECTRP